MNRQSLAFETAGRLAMVQICFPRVATTPGVGLDLSAIAGFILREALALQMQAAGISVDAVQGGGPLGEAQFTILSPRPKEAAAAALALLRRLNMEGLASVWYFNADEMAMFCLSPAVGKEGLPYDPEASLTIAKSNQVEAARQYAALRDAILSTPRPPEAPKA